jgi:hypothetical protein
MLHVLSKGGDEGNQKSLRVKTRLETKAIITI